MSDGRAQIESKSKWALKVQLVVISLGFYQKSSRLLALEEREILRCHIAYLILDCLCSYSRLLMLIGIKSLSVIPR